MKATIYMITFTLGILFMGISCEKHHDPITATLTILEPLPGDTIAAGGALHMHGTVVGSGELHGYSLTLTNLTTNQVVFSGSNANHATSYAFDEHWVNAGGAWSNMRLTLEVELDHDGNSTSKSVDFIAGQ
jgi:hypothetical protein